jgi:hypothetical protein
MIFLTRDAGLSLADLAERVADRPILVVGESPGFAAEGGMINFVLEGTKLRFEVNPSAATRAGLSISSRLLKLARVVKD